MAERVVKEISTPVIRKFEFELPGGNDETLIMTFSTYVPNLEKAVQAFANAVWEWHDNE